LRLVVAGAFGVEGKRTEVGAEVLLHESFNFIKGKRVGLVTNQTGVIGNLRHIADVLYEAPEVKLTALFGPEHGIRGDVQDALSIESYIDERTGLPVYSLYGETRKPTAEMLSNIDVLLLDLQDVGARYYTYLYTMSYAMMAAAEAGIKFVVLDRPNPINGVSVEGNILELRFRSFVGQYPIPVRYGMTIGELAMLFNGEYGIDADLTVIKMNNWRRDMWFDDTGLIWVQPSPNIPTLEAATVYPGTCLLEGTNVSEGRGTTKPFEVFGAPWMDCAKLTAELASRDLQGVLFRQAYFIPTFSKYRGERCCGVQVHVTDRRIFKPFETGLHIIDAINRIHPDEFEWIKPKPGSRHYYFDLLVGTDRIREQLQEGLPVERIIEGFQDELSSFMEVRRDYLLYDNRTEGSMKTLPVKEPCSVDIESLEETDEEFEKILTEQRNPRTIDIDRKSITEILRVINAEDKKVPYAVEKEIPNIARAVKLVVRCFRMGGRLFYVGSGTSGRLGVIDAAECPPTFSTPQHLVQGIIAGGKEAVWRSIEGAEDDYEDGRREIIKRGISAKDVVVGLSASGRTPFVVAALLEAKKRGAKTVAVSTTPNSKIGEIADVAISPLVGPEVITGSTRMKAGTAEKLVLNMISTTSMVKIGKVYSNLMIDLKPVSEKLRSRARRIIKVLTGVDSKAAYDTFIRAGCNLKIALVMIEADVDRDAAVRALKESSGIVWKAIEIARKGKQKLNRT